MPLLSADDWVRRILEVNRYKAPSGTRSPYKPLLLLWLIGRVANGHGSAVMFRDAEESLARLLAPHAIASTKPQPAIPFAALANDPALWSVTLANGDAFDTVPRPSRRNARFLRDESATGRLAPRFVAALGDGELRDRVANELLMGEFPESLHPHILTEVGLARHVRLHRPTQDPEFRRNVMDAYGRRCAMCGFSIAMSNRSLAVGLEAAHIKMPSKGGPYEVANGMLLCELHRSMFDWGALGIDEHNRISVSSQMTSSDAVGLTSLLPLQDRPLRCPHRQAEHPSPDYIAWHRQHIFKH